jgi:hypothetical protein
MAVRPHEPYTGVVYVRDPEREREAPYERVEPRRHLAHRDRSEFDRIAFAMRALRRLNPRRMTVAVYTAVSTLRVESGRDFRGGDGARWAIVGIPPGASREHIAYALVELAGVAGVPYAVQAILADDAAEA